MYELFKPKSQCVMFSSIVFMDSKRLKIVIACTHSLGAKFLEGQIRFLVDAGFDVYAMSAAGPEIQELCEQEGATLVVIPFSRKIEPFKDLKQIFAIRKHLKQIRPDIINTGTPKAGLLVTIAGYLYGKCPVIFTLRGLRSDTLSGMKYRIVKWMESLTCTLADKVIVISSSLVEHVVKHRIAKPKKIVLLGRGSSNGVNVGRFSFRNLDLEVLSNLKVKYAIKESDFVIGFVGRVTKDKGIEVLYDCFTRLRKQHPHVKLMIVGSFEKEDPISNEVKQGIMESPYITVIPHTKTVECFYALFSVLILPSFREGFGNVLIEAAAMGKPVIASRIPGCIDAVSDGHNGFLFEKGNPSDLHKKMELYIQDTQLLVDHGRNGRKFVLDNFENSRIWNEQINLYKTLLNKKV